MRLVRRIGLLLALLSAATFVLVSPVSAAPGDAPPQTPSDCRRGCNGPDVGTGQGVLTAALVSANGGGGWTATNEAPPVPPYIYRLVHPCVWDDDVNGGCRPSDFIECPAPPDRVVVDLVIQARPLVLPGPRTDNNVPFDPAAPVGTPVGDWERIGRGCVDITALNPPPSPAEIFRYFQTLPLPQLTTQHQPPGNGLVGLPVIFYTDSATTQTFDLTIRGFQVQIVAGATGFTWHTGDGTELTSTTPGAPYPNHTISHDYRSGTYTAYLTVTWGATFSVNGGPSVAVPGTTTTDGPPVTFTVLQSRPVLTNPYD
jgi:hypothetical protein